MPEFFSKNMVFCLHHFTADLFTNKAQFERLNLYWTIFDPAVMSQHTSNCFYNVFTTALTVITDHLICIYAFLT